MTKPNTMAQAAFALGLMSLFMLFTGSAFIPGSLAIICAFLSRRERMPGQARIGAIFAAGGMVIQSVMLIFLIWFLMTSGLFARFYEEAKTLDTTNPIAVDEFQQDVISSLQEALIKEFGPAYEPRPYENENQLPATGETDSGEVTL